MQSILRWSLENSTPMDSAPGDRPPVERKDLDPGIIDLILGKPDSVQMKEDIEAALDTTRTEEERISALDHLEMLIEHIDNANDMETLKLWEPLQSLLTAETSTPEIKTQAIWVIGTALQNNPSAQDVYLTKNPIPVLLSFLDPSSSTSASTRAKALYALSGLLNNNAPAVQVLDEPGIEGWTKLGNALQDPSIAVRRKAIFLLRTLLIPGEPATVPFQLRFIPAAPTPAGTNTTTTTNNNNNSTTSPALTSASGAMLHIGPPAASSGPTNTPRTGPSTAFTEYTGVPHNILTPDQHPSALADPIHANSHAAHLRSPSRSATSPLAVAALREHGLLDAVISALVAPVPYGPDGDNVEADVDFEEKGVQLLYTYAVTCQGTFSPSQKSTLKAWIQSQKKNGEAALLEKWEMSRQSYAELVGKLV